MTNYTNKPRLTTAIDGLIVLAPLAISAGAYGAVVIIVLALTVFDGDSARAVMAYGFPFLLCAMPVGALISTPILLSLVEQVDRITRDSPPTLAETREETRPKVYKNNKYVGRL